ncbi:basic amino acid/polyamine antiporter [uncultured Clostridium sp.]|uniref:basic amino acid/polyamine antiporter n=1 Tax=uncultured Clostridium sp. TaxID=59620 RepID=UPI002607175F|nr:basic amino acid/polyamine antiporter [uncultured Clostridium sp.]
MEKKLGLIGLIALVVGSMIGGGIFQLPAEMANAGGPLAAIIAWIITGIGMFFLGKVFQILSNEKPELSGGIYAYAKEGFGNYIGFNSAWGYWISQTLGNVSYAVLLIYALKAFFPSMGGVKSITGVIISIVMIWGSVFIISKSMTLANKLNTIATMAKIVPVIFAIFLLFLTFKLHTFTSDFYGVKAILQDGTTFGSIFSQVKNGLLQIVWVFIGIESAVVISGRARNKKDVGKATIIGYLFTLLCYVLIVMLSFGSLKQGLLMNLQNPALGGVLQQTYGTWAAFIINIGVVISVLGAWVAWCIINAEVPMMVAKDGFFPSIFGKVIKSGAAINSLIVNAIIMQIAFLFAMFANNAFTAITNISTTLVLLPYILSALYLIKLKVIDKKSKGRIPALIYAVVSLVFSLYAVSTSGIAGILQLALLYSIGLVLIFITAREQKKKMFEKKWELMLCIIITILGIMGVINIFL